MIAAAEIDIVETGMLKMETLQLRLSDLRPGLERIADSLEKHVSTVFATEGSHLGLPWTPLRANTVKSRFNRWGYYRAEPGAGVSANNPILQWTGRMKLSFRKGDSNHVRRISADLLEWGSRLKQAVIHGRNKKRPIMGFNVTQTRTVIAEPFLEWFTGRKH